MVYTGFQGFPSGIRLHLHMVIAGSLTPCSGLLPTLSHFSSDHVLLLLNKQFAFESPSQGLLLWQAKLRQEVIGNLT